MGLRLVCSRTARVATVAAIAVGGVLVSAGAASASLADKPAQTWGTNGRVDAVLPVGGHVVVGGTFTAVVDRAGNSYPADNLALFDPATGTFDTSWQGGVNDSVTGLAAANGRLYVGGRFSHADGQRQRKIAALDLASGALDTGWQASANAPVDSVAVIGDSVYASGRFTSITDATGTHARPYVAKLDAATGALDTAWTPTPDGRTRALAASPDGTELFMGGDFTKVDGMSDTHATAAVSATGSGAVVTSFHGTPTNDSHFSPVIDLATDGSNLYVAAAGSGGACTAMRTSDGSRVWSHHGDGNMQAVTESNGIVYCGGHFSGTASIDGSLNRNKLFAVDAASGAVTDFAPRVNSALGVWALGADASHLYAGGDFTKVTGVAAQHFAEFGEGTGQTPPGLPGAPSLTATAGSGVVHLSWTPPSDTGGSPIKRYKVYRTTSGNFGRPLTVVRGATTYDDTSVTNGVSYTYEVTAVTAVGEGTPSATVTVTPQASGQGTPEAPGVPTVTATVEQGVVHLSWTLASDGGSPIIRWVIRRDRTHLATVKSATSYDDTAVTSGVSYTYQVRAVNAIGAGPYSDKITVQAQ